MELEPRGVLDAPAGAELEDLDALRPRPVLVGHAVRHEEPVTGLQHTTAQDGGAGDDVVQAVAVPRVAVAEEREVRPEPGVDEAHPVLPALVEERRHDVAGGDGADHLPERSTDRFLVVLVVDQLAVLEVPGRLGQLLLGEVVRPLR